MSVETGHPPAQRVPCRAVPIGFTPDARPGGATLGCSRRSRPLTLTEAERNVIWGRNGGALVAAPGPNPGEPSEPAFRLLKRRSAGERRRFAGLLLFSRELQGKEAHMRGLNHLHRAGVVIALAVVGGAIAPVLSSAPAFPAGASVTVSPASTPAGGTVSFNGVVPTSGTPSCAPGPATLTDSAALFPPDGFGPQASRNASGAFHVTFHVPGSTPPGTYSVGLRCGGGLVGVSTSLTVTRARAATPMAGIPRTTG